MTARRTATPLFISVADAAIELACSDDSVLRAIGRGALPAFRDGRLVRVKRTDLDAYIAARMTTGGRRLRAVAGQPS